MRFDITRSPNPHVGFGAAGPHLCLGAHLARREMTVMLRELLTPVPGMVAGEPGRLLSSFINGIKRLTFLPAARQVLDRQGELPVGHRQCQRRGWRLELRDEAVPQRGDAHPAGRFARAEHADRRAGDAVLGET